jgi:hypothetical protein
METLREALDRLVARGYDGEFFVRNGQFVCRACGDAVDPEKVVIEDVVRFEGESDPDEQMAVYAISCGPCGRKGTYTVGFGPEMAPEDIDVVTRLNDGRRP